MELPARFGKYELIRRLAKGGMAEIFLARSFGVEGFERHLVIKRILPDLASSAKFVGLFIKEAKISASLSHPNIVQIYELGRVSSDHYIAMEHIHGRDLTRLNSLFAAFKVCSSFSMLSLNSSMICWCFGGCGAARPNPDKRYVGDTFKIPAKATSLLARGSERSASHAM